MTLTPEPAKCPRPDCPGRPGTIMATGFCDSCHRLPPDGATRTAPRPAEAARQTTARSAAPPASGGGALDSDGLVLLPHVPEPALSEAIDRDPRPPTGGRRCGVDNCPGIIGVGYGGRPAPDQGYCPLCGHPYSFRPRLRAGDIVDGHYRVLGPLAAGGLGWVYLAEDTKVPDLRVVLKGLINTGNAVARRAAVEERRSLTTLHHRDIVRIITHVQHQAADESEPTGYIVMEYIAGRSLNSFWGAGDEELTGLFGEPFAIDHVITYGCKILGALEYLHEQGLLYCDMKPDNVIHYGREIKVIDLGAVRRTDDRTSGLVYTGDYAPPRKERDSRGFHVDSDLHTVGRTLKVLAERAAPAAGLAAGSFDRLVRRATHPEPAARFRSAPEMSRQLWEVLREHRALARHEQYPERSTRYEPTAVLIGAGLGAVPPLGHWTARPPGAAPPELPVTAPGHDEAVEGLPAHIPDPRDTASVLLGALAAGSPERVVEQSRHDPALQSVETALWLCRAYLAGADPEAARRWLRTAGERMGPDDADHDWRLRWYRGVLDLTRGRIREAQGAFDAAYDALPGEWAPKLALGYCAEHLGAPDTETVGFYDAVWQRDRTQGSAAFGLVRAQLRRGDRAGAVAVLDKVPTTSRHHDAARVAALRVLTGPLPAGPPTVAGLREADERLAALRPADGESRDRLVAELRENALAARPPGGWGPGFPAGRLFGRSDDPDRLRVLLSASLKGLADQARDAGERGDLLDRAYAVLPERGLAAALRTWRSGLRQRGRPPGAAAPEPRIAERAGATTSV